MRRVRDDEAAARRQKSHLMRAHLQHHVNINVILEKGLEPDNIAMRHTPVYFNLGEKLWRQQEATGRGGAV
jgi:hypothetical protein